MQTSDTASAKNFPRASACGLLVAVAVAVCLAVFPAHASAARTLASNYLPGAAPCVSSVKVTLGVTYAAKVGGYRVSALYVRGLCGCVGDEISIVLTASSGAPLKHVTHEVSAADAHAGTLVLPIGGSIRADRVADVSVTLIG